MFGLFSLATCRRDTAFGLSLRLDGDVVDDIFPSKTVRLDKVGLHLSAAELALHLGNCGSRVGMDLLSVTADEEATGISCVVSGR